MTDIQRARDVLAKWRKETTLGPWQVNRPTPEIIGQRADYVGEVKWLADLRMIVGTAGNPDLLDAIDGVLAAADLVGRWETEFLAHANRLAVAIIAADERMSA
ncbi:hypothetical protein [Curtobacterium poinsettiae]|uniref:hypothetical protein n=1 Tax=Curtobacterium poinsettiae TaxID=159612 RepID=UPI00217D3E6C|nr:hypothetical protein [Curtobacterium flaccumfaciens]MCS6578225.1 hypothetical protein [Curtobacterium flaccumfaciens]